MEKQKMVDLLLRGVASYKSLGEDKYEFKYDGDKYVRMPDCQLGIFDVVSDVVYDYTDDELPQILDKVNNLNSNSFNTTFFCTDNTIKIRSSAFVGYGCPNLKYIDENRFHEVCEAVLKNIMDAKLSMHDELPTKKTVSLKGKSWILWLILFLVAFFLLRSCFSCGGKSTVSESPIQNNSVPTMNSGEDYPFTAQRVVSESELASYSDNELSIMRNEIFARHGYIFKRSDLKAYFSTKSWYNPQYSNVDNMLSKTERKNVEIISKVEKKRK